MYGALDSFVAWELEFPLIAVKKALRALEEQQEWKRIIQVLGTNFFFLFVHISFCDYLWEWVSWFIG